MPHDMSAWLAIIAPILPDESAGSPHLFILQPTQFETHRREGGGRRYKGEGESKLHGGRRRSQVLEGVWVRRRRLGSIALNSKIRTHEFNNPWGKLEIRDRNGLGPHLPGGQLSA